MWRAARTGVGRRVGKVITLSTGVGKTIGLAYQTAENFVVFVASSIETRVRDQVPHSRSPASRTARTRRCVRFGKLAYRPLTTLNTISSSDTSVTMGRAQWRRVLIALAFAPAVLAQYEDDGIESELDDEQRDWNLVLRGVGRSNPSTDKPSGYGTNEMHHFDQLSTWFVEKFPQCE